MGTNDALVPPAAPAHGEASRRRMGPVGLAVTLGLLGLLFCIAGLAAGSSGWSFHWGEEPWIIWSIRAPRTLGALGAGALLGLGGAIAQGVFRNPLADPYLLGSASGATLAVIGVLSVANATGHAGFTGTGAAEWLMSLGLVGAAFAGALGGVGLTLAFARGTRRPVVLMLSGIVVGVLLGAVANLAMLISPDAMRNAQVFLIGSTSFLGWRNLTPIAATLAITLPLAIRYSRALDALVLGEATATSLGIDITRVRWLLIATMALCTATAVAETGLIGFVGLVAPHLVRRSVVVTHGTLLALAALSGGVLLLGADVVSRVALAPQELPVGLLTAVIGGGYLLVLLRGRVPDGEM